MKRMKSVVASFCLMLAIPVASFAESGDFGSTCGQSSDCASGYTCSSSSKKCLISNGNTCTNSVECASGYCKTGTYTGTCKSS